MKAITPFSLLSELTKITLANPVLKENTAHLAMPIAPIALLDTKESEV